MQSQSSTTPNADHQWIICCETYHYLGINSIKELCILCIQTSNYGTWYVKDNVDWRCFADALMMTAFEIQRTRHGIAWGAGDVDMDELKILFLMIIHKHSSIFVVDPMLIKMLYDWGYEDVERLNIAPTRHMQMRPETFCGSHLHTHPGNHCAQRTCHEIHQYLSAVYVPHLDTSVFKYESNAIAVHELHKYDGA